MSKLWKRLIMLGTLIGCMATAAWAGNVEVSIVDHNGGQVQYAEDSYYTTSINGSEEFEYHFDQNGRVAWKKATESGQPYIIRYTYDEKGNVIKAARSIERVSGGHTSEIDTYTYDNQGRVTTHEQRVSKESDEGKVSYAIDTFTYNGNQVVVESVDAYSNARRFEFTLGENGRVEKEIKYRGENKDNLSFIAEIVYTYDENGNLEKAQTYMDDMVTNELLYLYNENNKCIRMEDRSIGLSSYTAFVYEYDENRNVISTAMLYVDEKGENEREFFSSECTYERLSPVQDEAIYTDVTNKTEYYYDAINWAAVTGVTAGVGDNQFAPNQGCTRAQLVSFLWRAAGEPEPETTKSPFTDVQDPNEYYYKAVLWAAENGIAAGVGNNQFAPNQTCTRAQIVSFIYRASGDTETYTENPFQDVSPKDYYYKAVLWGAANGVVAGTSDTTFSPNETCTRAQGVSFLYRGIGLY